LKNKPDKPVAAIEVRLEQKALSNQSTVANFWPQNLNYTVEWVGIAPLQAMRHEGAKKKSRENRGGKMGKWKKNSQLADTNEKSNKYSIERKAFKATACQRARAATNGPCHVGLSPVDGRMATGECLPMG